MTSVPKGFRVETRGPVLLAAREDLWPGLMELPLLDPGGIEELASRGDRGAKGRGSTTLLPVPGHPERLFLRRLRHGGVLGHGLGERFLGPGRALQELRVTAELRERGAPVPAPALVWGRRSAGPLWTLVVATVYVDGARDGLRFLRSRPGTAGVVAAAAALGSAVRRFHDAGGRHADLHVKNLLLRPRDGGFEAIVVDLDRARLEELTPSGRMRQLMRLYRSLRKRRVLDAVGPRGCAAFFGAYCGPDRELRQALRARLAPELRRVALHSLHYRTS